MARAPHVRVRNIPFRKSPKKLGFFPRDRQPFTHYPSSRWAVTIDHKHIRRLSSPGLLKLMRPSPSSWAILPNYQPAKTSKTPWTDPLQMFLATIFTRLSDHIVSHPRTDAARIFDVQSLHHSNSVDLAGNHCWTKWTRSPFRGVRNSETFCKRKRELIWFGHALYTPGPASPIVGHERRFCEAELRFWLFFLFFFFFRNSYYFLKIPWVCFAELGEER